MVGSYSAWSTLALLIVILVIPVCLWIYKKFWLAGSRSGRLHAIEWLPVGPRDRLVVVYTGNEYLLIGSSAQGLTLIRELPGYVEVDTGGVRKFKSVLTEAIGDG